VELTFSSAAYRRGKAVTFAILGLLTLLLLLDGVNGLRRPRG
jgi:hypothetical protein